MSYNKETNEYEGYIYLITNLINNKKYVGQTTQTIKTRWNQHVNASKKNYLTIVDQAIKKHGKNNFSIQQLEYISKPNKEQLISSLNELEKQYIMIEKSLVSEYGYNVDKGGQTGNYSIIPVDVYNMEGELINHFNSREEAGIYYGIHKDTVKSICLGLQENYNCEIVFRREGHPFDEFNVVSSNYREVYQFSLDGKLIRKYYNMKQIVDNVGIDFVCDIIDNPYRTGGGYWWSSKPVFNYKKVEKKKKPVDLYTKDMVFVKHFESASECGKFLNISSSSVTKSCRDNKYTVKGYIAVYHNPEDRVLTKDEIRATKTIVNQYTLSDEFVSTHDNIADITEQLIGKRKGCIGKCCKGIISMAYGYKWFYADDPNQPDKSKIITNSQEKAS